MNFEKFELSSDPETSRKEILKEVEVNFTDDAEDYRRLYLEKTGHELEFNPEIKPVFNTSKKEIGFFRGAFNKVPHFREEFADLMIEHEKDEIFLDELSKKGDPAAIKYLMSLGIDPGLEREDKFFDSLHEEATRRELRRAKDGGILEDYQLFIRSYLENVEKKIKEGKVKIKEEDCSKFRERFDYKIKIAEELLERE